MLPPPAPTVCTSTIGSASDAPADLAAAGHRHPAVQHQRHVAGGAAHVQAHRAAGARSPAARAAATAPPAGPESTVHDPCAAAVEASATPPLESMTSGVGQARLRPCARSAAPGSAPAGARARRRPRSWPGARTRGTPPPSRARWTRARPGARPRSPRPRPARARGGESPTAGTRRRASTSPVELAEPALRAPSRSSARSTPVGPAALRRRDPQLGRDQRLGVRRAEAVELGPRLAPELLEVGEALGGHQRGARGACPPAARWCPPSSRAPGARRRPAWRPARSSACADRGHHPLRLVVGRAWAPCR